jgi:hypothetical protein
MEASVNALKDEVITLAASQTAKTTLFARLVFILHQRSIDRRTMQQKSSGSAQTTWYVLYPGT